ncbi:hypothetical protein [Nocardia macrotermitis]|uniref:Uncharacterized protein n=1 Tax=Nocardia macrotermitis TaxID=2585198 RepID=A0A7K0D1K0_9NOCA|nr:hypothetical protein [Nocardia macrotermitis]MQY19551.1 hypothetical protein [Nocardia macrotermitis]
MNAPLDPSISDLLRGSSLAPMMDQPVGHILHSMGLPQLPTIPPLPPLPGLPPMPVIDLTAIVKPMTDMAASFGSGQFGGGAVHHALGVAPDAAPAANNATNHPATQQNSPAPQESKPQAAAPQPAAPAGNNVAGIPLPAMPNVDPTQVLSAITSGLQVAMQLGTSALQVVMQMWQGQGATQAASTGTQAAASGSQLATQGANQKGILVSGASSVFTGGALMSTVVGKYLTTMALTAPALSVPGGAAFMVAETADAIAEALAVITKTRVELTIHSANMTEAGTKVEVSSAPTGVDAGTQAATAADTAATTASSTASSSSSQMQQLMQLISPMSQLLTTGVQSASQLGEAAKSLFPGGSATAAAARVPADKALSASEKAADAKDSKGGASVGGGGGGGVTGIAAVPATPLTPYIGTQVAGGSTFGPSAAGAMVQPASATSSPLSSTSPGMMPMSSAGTAAAAAKGAAAAGAADANGNLVTGTNGDEVIGAVEGATLPVVGAYNRGVEAPPDKELTL